MPALLLSLAVAFAISFTEAFPSFLETRQVPAVKPTVGTWIYRGCYEEIRSNRMFTHRFDVPEGNSAERCTALCGSKGYALAGMQYGIECWCDNYMPYGTLRSDTECSTVCPGDPTGFCGAGNKMTVYENSAVTPPTDCITGRNWDSLFDVKLEVVPKAGGGSLSLFVNTQWNNPPAYSLLTVCQWPISWCDRDVETTTFKLQTNGELTTEVPYYVSVPPAKEGESPTWVEPYDLPSGLPAPRFLGWCAKPTHLTASPYIGKPLLSMNGDVASWAVCSNTTESYFREDVVWKPRADHPHYNLDDCRPVWIQIAKYE